MRPISCGEMFVVRELIIKMDRGGRWASVCVRRKPGRDEVLDDGKLLARFTGPTGPVTPQGTELVVLIMEILISLDCESCAISISTFGSEQG